MDLTTSKLVIRPLTADLWPALEGLFGKHGACNGCWCMYWRIGPAYHQRERSKNRAAFRRIVKQGPPPGLLAFDGEKAVGWCQLTPRNALPWLAQSRLLKPVDEAPVWSISCFYVRPGHRRQGVASALIAESVKAARRAGAPSLEAYPMEFKSTNARFFMGSDSTFRRAGFKTVARRGKARRIMRRDLRGR